jgi:hypothetical protein
MIGSEIYPASTKRRVGRAGSYGYIVQPRVHQSRQRSRNRVGDSSVYLTVCWIAQWPRNLNRVSWPLFVASLRLLCWAGSRGMKWPFRNCAGVPQSRLQREIRTVWLLGDRSIRNEVRRILRQRMYPLMAQSCRLVRCSKAVSNLRYTCHQINVFVTAAQAIWSNGADCPSNPKCQVLAACSRQRQQHRKRIERQHQQRRDNALRIPCRPTRRAWRGRARLVELALARTARGKPK